MGVFISFGFSKTRSSFCSSDSRCRSSSTEKPESTIEQILSHAEGGKQGIASRHADPEHLWKVVGMDYTMDGFRADVAAAMAEPARESAPAARPEADRLEQLLGPWIERIEDLPKSLRAQTRELLDLGVLNAGTADDPDDIRLPYNVLRALLAAKKYTDLKNN